MHLLRTRLNPAVSLLAAIALGATAATMAAAQPTTQPAGPTSQPASSGAISGKVTVAGGKPLPEMIVYLESPDPARKVDVPPKVVKVSQKDAKFTPNIVIIAAGQSVDFENDESRPLEHNVFSRSPARMFDLGLYMPGTGSKVVTFDQPGPVRLFCSIHRYMDGVVYVCPTPYFTRVGADGTWRIEGIPAGAWRLKTWQRNQRYPEQDVAVQVPAGGTADATFELSR